MKKIDVVKLFQSKSALVIDDFPDMRGSMRNMLKNFGCERIDIACTGNEAISFCRNRNYDVVLCDYNLGGGKSGQQVLEEMRFNKLLKNTSVFLMVTAESARDMVYSALEYLPDDYLTKPFTQPVLEKRLSRLVIEKNFLNAIYQAMDSLAFEQAIAICATFIESKPRYRQKCLRIQAWCHYELEHYDEAKAIYEVVIGERDVEWARIGFGKCLIQQGEIDQAHTVLSCLVEKGVTNAEVYDLLSEVEQKRGDRKAAQAMLMEAVKVSPHAIKRQKNLAKVSMENKDWEFAKKAHRQIIRLGNNSCYESPENHLEYVRCISDEIKEAEGFDPKLLREVENVLERTRKQFAGDKNVSLQTKIIDAHIQLESGNQEKFKQKKSEIDTILDDIEEAPPELTMDMVKLCQASGEKEKAQDLLVNLAARYSDDEVVSTMIDKITDEPITKIGKQKASNLNSSAKDLFDSSDYQEAVKLIEEALVIFPKNTSLNLNMITALIKQMQSDMVTEENLNTCQNLLDNLCEIPPSSTHFVKYELLRNELEKLSRSL